MKKAICLILLAYVFLMGCDSKNLFIPAVTMKDSDIQINDDLGESEWSSLSKKEINELEEIELEKDMEKTISLNKKISYMERTESVIVTTYVLYDDGNCNYDSRKLKRIKGVEPLVREFSIDEEGEMIEYELEIPASIANNNSLVLMETVDLVLN